MQSNNNRQNEEVTVDLAEVFRLLFGRLPLIFFAALSVGLAAVLVSMYLITPKYTSSTKLYVIAQTDNSNTVTQQDLQVGTMLTADYSELVKSREVAETVIAQQDLKDDDGKYITDEDLLDRITVNAGSDSRVVTISVTDDDPYEARDIAAAVEEAAADHIQSVMNTQAVNVVDTADVPDEPSSPNIKRNGVVGALIGALIAIIVVVAKYLSNDKIVTSEDVEKYLNISTLGTIPMTESEKRTQKHSRKRKKPKKR